MIRQIINRSVLMGALLYGVILAIAAVPLLIGFFIFGMVGYVPGLFLLAGLVFAMVLAAFPVGWFVARFGQSLSTDKTPPYSVLAGAASGALATLLPWALLSFLLGGLCGNVSTGGNPVLIGLVTVPALGALGGALFVGVGSKFDHPRIYKRVALVSTTIAAVGVIAFAAVFAWDMFAPRPVSPSDAATRAAYLSGVAASETRRAERISAIRASATAAANARASASPQASTSEWVTKLSDTFAQNEHDWQVGKRKLFGKAINQEIRDGKYRWALESAGYETAISGFWSVTSFQTTVVAQRVGGAEDCGYGIYLSPHGFVIRDSGEWAWMIDSQNNTFQTVVTGKATAIRPNQSNRVRVERRGAQYTFFVNEEWVGDVQMDATEKSDPGLMVENVRGGVCEIEFDEFEIQVPR